MAGDALVRLTSEGVAHPGVVRGRPRKEAAIADEIPPPLGLALQYLRAARGWNQQRLAAAAASHGRVISEYESGRTRRTLTRETFDRLTAAMGYGSGEVHLTLLFVAGLLGGTPEPPATPVDPSTLDERRIRRIAAHTGLLEAGRVGAELRNVARRLRAAEGRREGARLWEELSRNPPARWRQLVEDRRDFWTWGLAERLCEESERAAADEPRRALEWARLALWVAERTPGEAAWRSCLLGYCYAFVGNALRTAADLAAAESAFATAWNLWRAGGLADQGPLGEWRLLDLEASLRRDLRQFDRALDLLGRALVVAPSEKRGRILWKKASTLEQGGQVEASLSVLAEAAPLLDEAEDARGRMGLRFIWLANLSNLGRYEEAQARLPELRSLVRGLGNREDTARYRWLAARVAAGVGRREEARRRFRQLGREFAAGRDAYDAALVSLDLAILDLEDGRLGEVRKLAEEMVWVLASQRLHREVLAALRLFFAAVQAGSADAELARRVLAFLDRARLDRSLHFEGAK
jgi:tetratricopeptide (TPR) repeat protein